MVLNSADYIALLLIYITPIILHRLAKKNAPTVLSIGKITAVVSLLYFSFKVFQIADEINFSIEFFFLAFSPFWIIGMSTIIQTEIGFFIFKKQEDMSKNLASNEDLQWNLGKLKKKIKILENRIEQIEQERTQQKIDMAMKLAQQTIKK